MGDDFAYDDFCVCVLDDFLLVCVIKKCWHCLVAHLLSMGDDLAYEDLCLCVLDDVVLVNVINKLGHKKIISWIIKGVIV